MKSGACSRRAALPDEWHFHILDRAGFLALLPPRLLVAHVQGVVLRWLPLRDIVRCEAV
jgi:hypothetical protein